MSEGVNPTNVTNTTSNLISLEFFNQLHTLHNSFTAGHENPADNDLNKGISALNPFAFGRLSLIRDKTENNVK